MFYRSGSPQSADRPPRADPRRPRWHDAARTLCGRGPRSTPQSIPTATRRPPTCCAPTSAPSRISQEQAQTAEALSLRLIAVPCTGVGRRQRGARAGRVADRTASQTQGFRKPFGVSSSATPAARWPRACARSRRPWSLLAAIARPFLNWAGKAERLSFDVPTLPLFVHERLSTKAILETLKGHKRDKQLTLFDLFGDPQHSDRRPGAARLRVPGQLGQPHDPRRLAGGDELAAASTRAWAARCR